MLRPSVIIDFPFGEQRAKLHVGESFGHAHNPAWQAEAIFGGKQANGTDRLFQLARQRLPAYILALGGCIPDLSGMGWLLLSFERKEKIHSCAR